MLDPRALLQRLRAQPCGARLLAALAGRADAWLVGGAVRDLALGRAPRELDVVVDGDVDAVVEALGGVARAHDRFGTATVEADGCRYDLARTRRERYPRPGALPEVEPAGLDEDLQRRDVTVNAIALSPTGELRAAAGALDDLAAGRLRVLHDRSFLDDPTRLWRVARYAARLGFDVEEHTARLAAEAVAGGALDSVSGDRIGNELRLALREPDPLAALDAAARLGLIAPVDQERARRALALLPEADGRPDLLLLALAGADRAALDRWGFPALDRDRALRAAAGAPGLAAAERPSAIADAARGRPPEAIALAGADGAAEQARRWLDELRHVALEITGDDLLAAGIPAGPEVGRRLAHALARKLDGQVHGRADELAVALEAEAGR